VKFSIAHWIPGRIRLVIPALGTPSLLATGVGSWLRAQDWVKSARINHDCASLIVEYDRDKSEEIDTILALLPDLSVEDLEALIVESWDADGDTVVGARGTSAATGQDWPPMALPSLALALGFVGGPLAAVMNVPLVLWCALPVFQRALEVWQEERRLNVDFLDTLAIGISLTRGHMVTAAAITWLIRLGDSIRDMTAAGSRRAASELLEFQAKEAWVLRDGVIVAIPAAELAPNDSVVVYPGEMIPVDGEIIDGEALLDQKTITGESLPVPRGVSESVFAATIVTQGQLTIRASRVGIQTTAGQIARLTDAAPLGDTRIQNHAEKLADRLVLPTLALAAGTAAITADFDRFLSLVIVDYGTGIRVAAPTTVLASMTRAARLGIIIKSGAHLERLADVDTIVFDKTGTLSCGLPTVVDILTYLPNLPPDHLIALAVAAETNFTHPVANALRVKLSEFDVQLPPVDAAKYSVGRGVEAQVNGYYVHLGSERFMRESGIPVDHLAADRGALEERGCSCLWLAVDGVMGGLIAYEDRLRDESAAVVAALHEMGIRETVMLTGDDKRVAEAVAQRLGITRHMAEMLPADKAAVVQELQQSGRCVVMIGDGINDSPALSFADVGIAMRHGPDITREAADIVLMEDSLWKVAKAIEISRDAVSLIKQNYAIVTAMNTIALALAVPGVMISPVLTALFSNGSAILASLNGIRPALRNN
jgi:Cu2+-exporting ATPase